MRNLEDPRLQVLLPAKPEDDLTDVTRLLQALLPPGRTEVLRIYVHRPIESDYFLPDTYARFREIPRVALDAEMATRAETEREMSGLAAAGFRVSADVVGGTPVEEILREASLWRADLVAVRTRSAAAQDSRIGGMAAALMHHATCPVLTYHEVPAGYRVRRILIPVDFSRASRESADWGLAVAEVTGAQPVLLHVVARWTGGHGLDQNLLMEVAREEMERWRTGASATLSRPVRETHVVSADAVAEGILTFAREGEHDLVVLSGTGASAVRAILLGSNTRKVVRASAIPVLVVPSSNRVAPSDFVERARKVPPEEATATRRPA